LSGTGLAGMETSFMKPESTGARMVPGLIAG
jgi:hypothetical protein